MSNACLFVLQTQANAKECLIAISMLASLKRIGENVLDCQVFDRFHKRTYHYQMFHIVQHNTGNHLCDYDSSPPDD